MENKIDRLFQDKLARYEVTPTPQAWEKVKAELDGKGKPMIWLRIAASVALLMVSAFLILRSTESVPSESSTFVTPDHPMPLANFQWNLPEIEPRDEVKKEAKLAPIKTKLVVKETLASVEETQKAIRSFDNLQTIPEMPLIIEIELEEAVAVLEVVNRVDNKVEALPQFQVQITYKASESPVELPEQKTKVGKLWAKARQIKPGEMLASMRETKNDFFSGKKN